MALTETKEELLKELRIEKNGHLASLEAMSVGETRYLKDLKINLKNALGSENLTPKEANLIALAISVNEKNKELIQNFTKGAQEQGATDAEIAETHACASLLAVNNVFYRFRHFMQKDSYNNMPAGIKMNIMLSPVLGKEFFELMSLAVSAVNGCEKCVTSHEASVRNMGSSEARIFDAVKLASIIRGLSIAVN
ncbi:MAG TPA: carboxymuconolactone decarboxylase family protein [Ignavibacteriales bacterium]|nr:carboxymuconolactone decarboxylase family protein [Ignavibacteriales bacterium]